MAEAGVTGAIVDVCVHVADPGPGGETLFYERSFEDAVEALKAVGARGAGGATVVASRGADVWDAYRTGRTAIFPQFQGAEPLGDHLHRLDLFRELGLRVLQLTHHHGNAWAGGCLDVEPSGLTVVGVEGVARAQSLGIMVDLAHASDLTALDVVRTATRPVVISHTGPRAIVPNPRCAPDDVIRAVAGTGGVVGLFMMSCWVSDERGHEPTVDAWIRALRHLIDVAGVEGVAIANDYPLHGEAGLRAVGNDNRKGATRYRPFWTMMRDAGVGGFERPPEHVVFPELNHIDRLWTIMAALERAEFPSSVIEKVMGGNWIRVLTDAIG